MKVLILNASPRRKGNISQMVGVMKDEAESNGAEVEVVDVLLQYLVEIQIVRKNNY